MTDSKGTSFVVGSTSRRGSGIHRASGRCALILAGVATLVVLVLPFVLLDARDHARLRHLERMERIRIRASRVRHRLVMLAGAGEIAPAERVAFEFIYRATTMLLRFPPHYRFMSDSLCIAILEREADPGRPPRLRFEDLSDKTRAMLVETDEALDAMIDRFSHPVILAMATISGRTIPGRRASRFVTDFGIRARIRQLERERKALDEWRAAAFAAKPSPTQLASGIEVS